MQILATRVERIMLATLVDIARNWRPGVRTTMLLCKDLSRAALTFAVAYEGEKPMPKEELLHGGHFLRGSPRPAFLEAPDMRLGQGQCKLSPPAGIIPLNQKMIAQKIEAFVVLRPPGDLEYPVV